MSEENIKKTAFTLRLIIIIEDSHLLGVFSVQLKPPKIGLFSTGGCAKIWPDLGGKGGQYFSERGCTN